MDHDQPLTYEFAYVNHFQESVIFVSHEPYSASVVLPMGHESNDFKLKLKVQISDHLGAAATWAIEIQVRKI